MNIHENIIKHCLKNVMFITGTAYAGKSTMVALLAEKHGLVPCGENYHFELSNEIATPDIFPNLCYFQTMKDWQEFVNRTPEEYERWIYGANLEIEQFEIAHLMRRSQNQRIIVDTNIPLGTLHKIADYNQVAVMLSPQSMSVEKFFERGDKDKAFIKSQIMKSENPELTMANYLQCIARTNSKERYDEFVKSGFFTLVRESTEKDTKREVLEKLERHFGLV